jgi:hypothetical protein
VTLAKRMRELFNSYINIARDHALTEIDHGFRTYMRIGDYCQMDRIRKQRNAKMLTKKKRKDAIMQGNNA